MNYTLLSKYYYENTEKYALEYEKRFNSSTSVFKLPVNLKNDQAFIVVSTEVLSFVQKIYEKNNKVTRLFNRLPKVAINAVLYSSLVEEIKMSNEIENIHSSRKSIAFELRTKPNNEHKKPEGVIKKYQRIVGGEKIAITSASDIRELFDDMLSNEIDEKDKPDGIMFRKNEVVLTDDIKTYHVGVLPEEKIMRDLERLIKWLHDEEVPQIIRIAGFHFLFGYIHPFYDGNGRLNRFISASLMTHTLNFLTALRLSAVLNANRRNYYKAFEICEDPKNRGDITFFILTFLEYIYQAIGLVITDLTESKEKLNHYDGILNNNFKGLDRDIMNIAIQNTAFSEFGLSIKEITDALFVTTSKSHSSDWIRKKLERLKKDGYIASIQGKPIYYKANFVALDALNA